MSKQDLINQILKDPDNILTWGQLDKLVYTDLCRLYADKKRRELN